MTAPLLLVAVTALGCAGRSERGDAPATGVDSVAENDRDSGAEADGPISCGELFSEFHLERLDVTAEADRECNAAADCQVAGFGDSCFAGCGHMEALASSAVEASRSMIDALAERYCAASAAQGCVHIPLPCDPGPPVTAECVAGRCSLVFDG